MDTLVVISDLHIGPDGGPPMFAGGDQIEAALAALPPATHLVLNGDTFDLLAFDAPRVDCSEVDATRRLASVLGGPDAEALRLGLRAISDRGGAIRIRAGNHDLELAMPAVQARVREWAGVPLHIDAVPTWSWADGRVVVEHGEADDDWNRFDHARVGAPDFAHPPGTGLVLEVLNRARGDLPFLDALKPDLWGAAVAACGIDPRFLRRLARPAVARVIAELWRRKIAGDALLEGMPDVRDHEGLDAWLHEPGDAPGFVGDRLLAVGWEAAWRTLRPRLVRRWRAGAAEAGERFFELPPTVEDWDLARRRRDSILRVHVAGHTHAARWGIHDGLTVINTGTWTWLLRLPGPMASEDEWTRFLDGIRSGRPGEGGGYRASFTAAWVDAKPTGVHARLVRWHAGAWSDAVERRPIDRAPEERPWTFGISRATASATDAAVRASLGEWEGKGLADPGLPSGLLEAGRAQILARLDRWSAGAFASGQAREDVAYAAGLRDLLALAIDQRRSPDRRRFLQWADAIAQEAWFGCLDRAGVTEARLPPVVIEQAVPSPLVWASRTPMDAPGLAGGQRIRAPFPVIVLPPDHVALPWRMLTVLHEVGHLLDDRLGISGAVRAALEGLQLGERAPEWRRWTPEIIADHVGLVLGGRRYADVLNAVLVGLAADDNLPAWDHAPSHPPPTLRLGLLEAWGAGATPCEGWRQKTSPARADYCDQVSAVADAVRAVTHGGVPLAHVLGDGGEWCRLAEEALYEVADLGALEVTEQARTLAIGRFQTGAGRRRLPGYALDEEQLAFLSRHLPRLAPTYGRAAQDLVKVPPIPLLRRHDRLIFVGAANDQLERQMAVAFDDRAEPWDEVEVFFLDDDAAMEELYPGKGSEMVARRDEAIEGLFARLREGGWARRWRLWRYRRAWAFASFWTDKLGERWHVHVSSPVWGRGIRDAPSVDYVSTSAGLVDDPEVRAWLGGVSALRDRARLVASG